MSSDFVGERGGGLLVLGGRSFAQRGLSGTPLEEVLPVELNDRHGGAVRAALTGRHAGAQQADAHAATAKRIPIMRIGAIDGRHAQALVGAAGAGGERAARRRRARARRCWR